MCIRDSVPLVEAFRATLEEALDADVLLLVVDLADPDWQGHLATVHRLLDELGSTTLRRVIGNQIDRCEANAIETIHQREPDALFLSAVRGDGMQGLKQWLREQFFDPGAESAQLTTGDSPPWPS